MSSASAPAETVGARRLAPLPASGGWLAAARIAWVLLVSVTLGLTVAGLPGRFEQLQEVAAADPLTIEQLGLSDEFVAGYLAALDMFVVLAHIGIAAFIFKFCKSDRKAALFISYALVANGALLPLGLMYQEAVMAPGWRILLDGVIYIGLVSGAMLLYLFPDGRFVPNWTRPLAMIWAALAFYGTFLPTAPLSFPTWPLLLQVLALLVLAGTGVYAQIYRYLHISSPVQRQQAKWAAFGLTAAAVGPFAYYLPLVVLPALSRPAVPNFMRQLVGPSLFSFSLLFRLISSTGFTMVLLLFPLSFAIAILRYRLWDIDVLINRTLVYGALTGTLALVYFASIVLLQAVFRVFTGQDCSAVVTVVSTLAIAALFVPLRHRVQDWIDRRFYRRKYAAAKMLSAFSATARDETDLGRLTDKLLAVVQETMQPEHVSLWLMATTENRR